MNAAFPEQVYRPPGKENKDRLDYWDLCKDPKYNQLPDFPEDENNQVAARVKKDQEDGKLDPTEVAAGAADDPE